MKKKFNEPRAKSSALVGRARRHGKILEEGASGFLEKKLNSECNEDAKHNSDVDWDISLVDNINFGSKHWASILPVEEIDDVDGSSSDPFVADAVANERDLNLTGEQKRNFRKAGQKLYPRARLWVYGTECVLRFGHGM
ncbi:Protein CHROMATIN REMODELING 20 [Abeliophyllum distichum]|uniref:Protein CHROMATIN REMODELING 20 n=1 Tax=Abeliophyllum distichum TaxID=126358 RepID=A0ABD1PBL8_9LAMI